LSFLINSQKSLKKGALDVQIIILSAIFTAVLHDRAMILQLGREALQRTNVEEIIQLLKAHKRGQAREEESHSRRQSQSSPRKGPKSEASSTTDFDDDKEDDVSPYCGREVGASSNA
jgi:hypothetical protein